uniref:Zn(2)-C6 fungal-type domain-containing protein n=1 Tax=Sordaria araneosa TaxID=573841 RepID=A0A1B4XBG3_SORAA|nr:hypothetical protein [Sordaria araneosa]
MFQTLKAQSGAMGDMEYVVQSSLPANDKVKGMKKQAACTRCKMKKLRCKIEADGCEKCVESGVACSYGGTRRQGRGSISSSSGGQFGPGSSSASSTSSGPSSVDSSGSHADTATGSIRGTGTKAVSPRDQIAQSCTSRNCEIHVDTTITCRTPTNQGNQDPISASLDTVMGTPSFLAELGAGGPPGFNQDDFTHDLQGAQLPDLIGETLQAHDLQDFGICFCTDLVVSANASMQVRLVWSAGLDGNSTSSIEDILQCQKNVLASCDSFFQCKRCSSKPDYVVLVISMCREMVDGVKALEQITSPEGPRSRSRRSHLGHTDASNKPRLEAGGWQLDDNDEIEIIRHLIQVRITKLRKLVGQLEHMVNAGGHASYGWMVGNLRKSLDEKSNSASSLSRMDDTLDLV